MRYSPFLWRLLPWQSFAHSSVNSGQPVDQMRKKMTDADPVQQSGGL